MSKSNRMVLNLTKRVVLVIDGNTEMFCPLATALVLFCCFFCIRRLLARRLYNKYIHYPYLTAQSNVPDTCVPLERCSATISR